MAIVVIVTMPRKRQKQDGSALDMEGLMQWCRSRADAHIETGSTTAATSTTDSVGGGSVDDDLDDEGDDLFLDDDDDIDDDGLEETDATAVPSNLPAGEPSYSGASTRARRKGGRAKPGAGATSRCSGGAGNRAAVKALRVHLARLIRGKGRSVKTARSRRMQGVTWTNGWYISHRTISYVSKKGTRGTKGKGCVILTVNRVQISI